MPMYEYKCKKCGEKFEIRRSIFVNSKDREICPKCGHADLERIYSSFGTSSNSGSSCAV